LLKSRLGALHVAGLQVHLPHVRADARAHCVVLGAGQRSRQQPRSLLGLAQRKAQRHEARAQLVVTRIACDDGRQKLECARQIRQYVLPQDTEPALHFDAAWTAHLLELEAQHRDRAVGAAAPLVGVGQGRRGARGVRSILEQPLGGRQRRCVVGRQLQHTLDVTERARHVLERAQAQIDQLFAQQQRLVGRRWRLALQGLLEHVRHLLVTALGQQATHHPFTGRLVSGRNFQDALAHVDGQVVTARRIDQQLCGSPQQLQFDVWFEGARAGVRIQLRQARGFSGHCVESLQHRKGLAVPWNGGGSALRVADCAVDIAQLRLEKLAGTQVDEGLLLTRQQLDALVGGQLLIRHRKVGDLFVAHGCAV
jgi:hypothetical protein